MQKLVPLLSFADLQVRELPAGAIGVNMMTEIKAQNQVNLNPARWAIMASALLVALKLVVGINIVSVSVISEAAHSGLDLIAAIITFFSVKLARRPADTDHHYGHGKIENVSGTIEAILILVAGLWIIYEAVQHILRGNELEMVWPGMVVMAFSALVNTLVGRHLLAGAAKEDSVALKADAWHLLTDVFTSLAVVVGLLLTWITGWQLFDPLVALVVAGMIIHASWRLIKEAFCPLLDERLSASEEVLIRQVIKEHGDDYVEFHQLRTRRSGSQRYVDFHLLFPPGISVIEAHERCHHIGEQIESSLNRTKVMIHAEPCERCSQCEEQSQRFSCYLQEHDL